MSIARKSVEEKINLRSVKVINFVEQSWNKIAYLISRLEKQISSSEGVGGGVVLSNNCKNELLI